MPFNEKDADEAIKNAQRDAGQGEIDYNIASLQSAQIATAINLGRIARVLEGKIPADPRRLTEIKSWRSAARDDRFRCVPENLEVFERRAEEMLQIIDDLLSMVGK